MSKRNSQAAAAAAATAAAAAAAADEGTEAADAAQRDARFESLDFEVFAPDNKLELDPNLSATALFGAFAEQWFVKRLAVAQRASVSTEALKQRLRSRTDNLKQQVGVHVPLRRVR